MGISGLLKFLKQYKTKVSLSKYSGLNIAIDVSCWIHQGAYYSNFSKGMDISINKIIHFVIKKLRMFIDHKITPIVVFDGAPIPIKGRIQDERAKIRFNSREKIGQLLQEGRNIEASRKYGERFSLTPYLV